MKKSRKNRQGLILIQEFPEKGMAYFKHGNNLTQAMSIKDARTVERILCGSMIVCSDPLSKWDNEKE